MSNEWKNAGSDCCSPFQTCFLSACCPCFVYGRVQHRLKHNDAHLQNYESFNWECCLYVITMHFGVQWVLQGLQRSNAREKYGIRGNFCGDLCCSCCCHCCELVQLDKETEEREQQPFVGQPAPVQDMQYGGQQNGVMPPQGKPGY